MLNHITTNQCRMLLQEANFIKKQYPKRIKEFQEILKEDRSLIEMSVDISAKISTNTGGHTGEIKDLENERIKNQILIRNLKTEILYMDNRLNKGIEELTKLYNQNIVSDAETENEEK